MATANLFKQGANWMVQANGGERCMGATPEIVEAQFKELWAGNYPNMDCPEIVRNESLDNPEPAPATKPADDVKTEAPAIPSLEVLRGAMDKGLELQRLYAPGFNHPLMAPEANATAEELYTAIRSWEKGLSDTTGRTVILL